MIFSAYHVTKDITFTCSGRQTVSCLFCLFSHTCRLCICAPHCWISTLVNKQKVWIDYSFVLKPGVFHNVWNLCAGITRVAEDNKIRYLSKSLYEEPLWSAGQLYVKNTSIKLIFLKLLWHVTNTHIISDYCLQWYYFNGEWVLRGGFYCSFRTSNKCSLRMYKYWILRINLVAIRAPSVN